MATRPDMVVIQTRAVSIPALDRICNNWYDVPTWANYAARDESGKLWVYENEPMPSPESSAYSLGFWFPNVAGGNIKEIENPVYGRKSACPHWRKTLIKL